MRRKEAYETGILRKHYMIIGDRARGTKEPPPTTNAVADRRTPTPRTHNYYTMPLSCAEGSWGHTEYEELRIRATRRTIYDANGLSSKYSMATRSGHNVEHRCKNGAFWCPYLSRSHVLCVLCRVACIGSPIGAPVGYPLNRFAQP